MLVRKLRAAMLLLVMAGCDRGQADRIRIGFLVKQPEEQWFQEEWKFAGQCAERYGFELIRIGTPDGERTLSAIDNLAAQGAQGFVICTPDAHLGPAIMLRARAHGMKVIAVDDQFVGPDGGFMDVPYMGISAWAIGQRVGACLWEELRRRGWKLEETAACAITHDELSTAKERTDGAAAALVAAGFSADRIYPVAQKAMDVPAAFDAANVLLTRHPEVKRWLVYSANDEGVLGAIRAMEGRGFGPEQVIGIGIGAGSCLPEFEKPQATGFFATCLISPKRHGYETSEYLYRWIKAGAAPPKDTRTAGIIVTRETYRQVMQEQGLIE